MSKFKVRIVRCIQSDYKILDLSNLDLEELPDWTSFDPKIKNIKQLFINDNQLTNIDSIEYFTSLEILDISCNQIKSINYLPPTLQELCCYDNKISYIIGSPNLKKLVCSCNSLTEISDYPSLESLSCDNNSIVKIGYYPNLKYFSCWSNPISEIYSMDQLQELNCSQTNITEIPNMPSLEHLVCNQTEISRIPECNLVSLEMVNTKINSIPYMSKLQILVLSYDNDILVPNEYKIIDHQIQDFTLFVYLNGKIV